MGYQNLIYSASVTDGTNNGPWIDVGGRGSEWSIHIQNMASTVAVEVSNQINSPYSYYGQIPSVLIPQYPPYKYPVTVTTYTAEVHTIPASSSYTVAVTHGPGGSPPTENPAFQNISVSFTSGPHANQLAQYVNYSNYPAAQYVGGTTGFLPIPGPGQYTVNPLTGIYTFNAADAGAGITITYYTIAPASGVVLTSSLYYIPASATSGNVLVTAKSDICVKWVRITNSAAPGSTVAFLHTS